MSITVGTNISSLRAQRSLSESGDALSRSFTRLSSGLRINTASDDAAGLSIADSLKTKSRVQSTAIRNANDGISAINIVTSTLQNQISIVTRLSELAEQAANGSLSATQRETLNSEYNAMLEEYGRLADAAHFNGQKLMVGATRGGVSSISFQVGTDGSANSVLTQATSDTGRASGVIDLRTLQSVAPSGASGTHTLESLRNYYNEELIEYTASDGTQNAIAFRFTGGAGTFIYQRYQRGSNSTYTTGGGGNLGVYSTSTGYLADVTTSGLATLTGIDFTALRFSDTQGTVGPNLGSSTAIDFTGIAGSTGALTALDVTRRKIDELTNMVGQYGALQSRINTVVNVLHTSKEATIAAESRIRDVDVADEAASLVSSQIRQQVGAAILAQANQQPAIALTLLS